METQKVPRVDSNVPYHVNDCKVLTDDHEKGHLRFNLQEEIHFKRCLKSQKFQGMSSESC